MTREEALKMLRREIECLLHSKCQDCILEKVCDPMQEPTDDKYIEAYELAIKALEQEPCGDCISRQAVLDRIDRYIEKAQSTGTKDDFISFAELVVKELPSVKPQEPKPDIKALGEELRSVRNCITGDKILFGYNLAVGICNKYLSSGEQKPPTEPTTPHLTVDEYIRTRNKNDD